ncbi:MAG: tetratricopeptide repeat protein [Desulfomonilaceae bacterium]|jgi:Flp pilus assembly protein TadD
MPPRPKNPKISKNSQRKTSHKNSITRPEISPDNLKKPLGGWLKNVFLGLVVCFLALGFIEFGLRLFWTPDVKIDDPFVGFSSIHPLFKIKDGVASVSPIRLKYFNDVSFPVEKPPDSLRVFSFGESTTYGHPFDGRTSYSRWLEDILAASCPTKKVQVINAGGISYASYRIVNLVQESLQYNPDLVIMYVGHNEFLERRSYAGMFEQGPLLISLRSYMENLRIYRALETILVPIIDRVKTADKKTNQKDHSPNSNADKTLLNDEATTILDKSAGLDLYYHDEQFARGVLKHYAYNLREMISLCKQAHVPIILVETPSNLKDFSPFKSQHDSKLTLTQQKEIDRKLEDVRALLASGDFKKAVDETNEIERVDPLYALTYFLKGKALEAETQYQEARRNFVKAKDLDVCPLRATSSIIDQIDKIAAEQQAPLIKFCSFVDSYSKEHGSKSGIPGDESFLDHVHPTIELHQALAELLYEKIQSMGLISGCKTLNKTEIQSVLDQGFKSLDSSIYALRDLNLAKTLRWAGKKEEAKRALLRIAGSETDNPEVHKMLGSFALEAHQYGEAVNEYREAVKLAGGDPELKLSLAIALYKGGNRKEAQDTYEQILDSGHDFPEVYANLSMLWLETGRIDESRKLIEKGIEKFSGSSALYAPYALNLAISGRLDEAIKWMLKAVATEPGDPSHYYNLAGMYALNNQNAKAFKSLNMAIDRGYRNLDKLSSDPVFKNLRDQSEFKKIKSRLE